MKLKYLLIFIGIALCLLITFIIIKTFYQPQEIVSQKVAGTIIGKQDNTLFLQDENNIIYTFTDCSNENIDTNVVIQYSLENANRTCLEQKVNKNIDNLLNSKEEGLFQDYYELAYQKLKTMTTDEKIGQVLLARYPDNSQEILKKYPVAGFIFYEKDFQNKTTKEVQQQMQTLQTKTAIPLLMAVDEEGGKVVRVSSNPNLVASPFLSPSALYNQNGFAAIKEDTINKSKILKNLGLNLNLAPVLDVSEDASDYIYERTLKQNTEKVSQYAQTVIDASQKTGVSYVLKHFPGYVKGIDTHYAAAVSDISYANLKNTHLPPFQTGIDHKAEAVLVNHIIYNSIDEDNPASLSINAHNLLRDDLNFTGVIISDDLDMGATKNIQDKEIKALLAGNDLLIVTDIAESFNNIKEGLLNNNINENLLDKVVLRILAWKYYKGLMFEYEK